MSKQPVSNAESLTLLQRLRVRTTKQQSTIEIILCNEHNATEANLAFEICLMKRISLDDLERPKRTLAEKSFYGVHQKNLNKDRPKQFGPNC